MNNILGLFLVLALVACSVKDKGTVPPAIQTDPGQKGTPAEVSFRTGSKNKIFLKELAGKYILGEENKFTFRIINEDLRPLRQTEYDVKVEFHKVSDPKMGGDADVKWLVEGEFETEFYFCHHGFWEFNFSIVKAGQVVDTFKYQVDVKEAK